MSDSIAIIEADRPYETIGEACRAGVHTPACGHVPEPERRRSGIELRVDVYKSWRKTPRRDPALGFGEPV